MAILDSLKKKAAQARLADEALYARVHRELEAGTIRQGLWAQALQKGEFNEGAAKAHYFKLRVQSLKDELLEVDHQRSSRTVPVIPAKHRHTAKRTPAITATTQGHY